MTIPRGTTPEAAEPLSERVLLDAARAGSASAFGILYARHVSDALTTARRALAPDDLALAEDVVEAAFARVLGAVRHGGGPTDELQFYLWTVVRREAWRWQRRRRQGIALVDRLAADEDPHGAASRAVDHRRNGRSLDTHQLLTKAFESLPESWRSVLWMTEVEGRKPAEIAPILAIAPGSVSSLAYRARQGLSQAYVDAYCSLKLDTSCRSMGDRMVEFLAARQAPAGFADVVIHLGYCSDCRDLIRGVDVAAEQPAQGLETCCSDCCSSEGVDGVNCPTQ